jgi:hypothetical protein
MAPSTKVSIPQSDCRPVRHGGRTSTIMLQLTALLGSAAVHSQQLIVFGGSHDDPGYVKAHADWIESRPFDGMVISEFLGRNLLNTKLKAYDNAVLRRVAKHVRSCRRVHDQVHVRQCWAPIGDQGNIAHDNLLPDARGEISVSMQCGPQPIAGFCQGDGREPGRRAL